MERGGGGGGGGQGGVHIGQILLLLCDLVAQLQSQSVKVGQALSALFSSQFPLTEAVRCDIFFMLGHTQFRTGPGVMTPN